jgi:hypothetical protein
VTASDFNLLPRTPIYVLLKEEEAELPHRGCAGIDNSVLRALT